MRTHSAGKCGADTMQWRRNGERATARAYTPSVLVTMGMLILLSLGEDIFEIWGEVRADWVAAAILWGGDVGVVSWRSLCRTRSGLDLFLHTRLCFVVQRTRTRSQPNRRAPVLEARGSAQLIIDAVTGRDRWVQMLRGRKGMSQADGNVAKVGSDNSSEQRHNYVPQQRNRVRQMRGIGPFRSEVSILLTAAVLVAVVVSDCRISIVTSSP
jgi:hypothetical protein